MVRSAIARIVAVHASPEAFDVDLTSPTIHRAEHHGVSEQLVSGPVHLHDRPLDLEVLDGSSFAEDAARRGSNFLIRDQGLHGAPPSPSRFMISRTASTVNRCERGS
jgi:hypothetical protein